MPRIYRLVFSFFLLFSISSAHAQDPFLRRMQEMEEASSAAVASVAGTPTAVPKRFTGYAAFRMLFQGFCKQLPLDGRHEVWNAAISRASESRLNCKACRQLYKSLQCRSSIKGKSSVNSEKNKEEAKIIKALYPSTELIAVTSELFSRIAEDPQAGRYAAESLSPVLEDPALKHDIAEQEYFSILSSYIKSALKDYWQEAQKQQSEKKSRENRKILDNLF